MVKAGGSFGERAVSSCLTSIIWIVFLLMILAGVGMLVSYMGWGILPDEVVGWDFLGGGSKTYKEARRLAKSGDRELAIKKYNEFFATDAKTETKDKLIQAHMDVALLYLQMAQELSYNDPNYRGKNNDWCTKGIQHCEEVRKINPQHKTAEHYMTLLSLQRG